jgi:hypothetical protein
MNFIYTSQEVLYCMELGQEIHDGVNIHFNGTPLIIFDYK